MPPPDQLDGHPHGRSDRLLPRNDRTVRPRAGRNLSSPLRVLQVASRSDLKEFVDLPYRLLASETAWGPPLRRDVELMLSKKRNPFFEHADAEYFLAKKHGQTVGRIAAVVNHLHNEIHRDRVGFFGFFDTVRDQAVANALLDRASEWLSTRGLEAIRGPASFSVNDEFGVLASGYETPNTIMMPHNPPWYPDLLEGAGLGKVKTLVAYQVGSEEHYCQPPERIVRAIDVAQRRFKITLRPLRMDDFTAEVERIKDLYNRCWENNWGAIPMTDREIDHLAAQFKPVVIPNLVPFAEVDGKPIGFGLALPDFNQVFRRNRKGSMFPAALSLLFALKTKRIRRARILLLGVLPEYRGKGVDAILYHWIWTKAGELNMTWGEGGWVLEDNPAMNAGLSKLGMTPYKTYAVYERRL